MLKTCKIFSIVNIGDNAKQLKKMILSVIPGTTYSSLCSTDYVCTAQPVHVAAAGPASGSPRAAEL